MNNDFDCSIAVVGSVNLDHVARVSRFPKPGETLTNATLSRHPGGKGGNQALAAKRLGARVHLLACLGEDSAADEALATLLAEGVDLHFCRRLPGVSTGQALILVADDGENQIVVAPGANAEFSADLLDLPVTDAVIAQLEVPMDTILKAARRCQGLFCLNAAPAKPVAAEVLALTDLLVVNQTEAEALGGQLADFKGLLATTLGAEGAILSQDGRELARADSPRVNALDTVGAGDAFTAALTVALVSGLSPVDALNMACRSGALATTRAGAQSSPTVAELAAFLVD